MIVEVGFMGLLTWLLWHMGFVGLLICFSFFRKPRLFMLRKCSGSEIVLGFGSGKVVCIDFGWVRLVLFFFFYVLFWVYRRCSRKACMEDLFPL